MFFKWSKLLSIPADIVDHTLHHRWNTCFFLRYSKFSFARDLFGFHVFRTSKEISNLQLGQKVLATHAIGRQIS